MSLNGRHFALSPLSRRNPLNFYLNYRIKMIAGVSLALVSQNLGNESRMKGNILNLFKRQFCNLYGGCCVSKHI